MKVTIHMSRYMWVEMIPARAKVSKPQSDYVPKVDSDSSSLLSGILVS